MTDNAAATERSDAPVSVGIRMLNQHTRKVLDIVRDGRSVVVTDHGHPIARIIPETLSPLEQIIARGDYLGRLDAPLAPPPGTDMLDKPDTSTTLDDIRSDRI